MCRIVGYVGSSPAAPYLIEGLTRLKYRGYDSPGIALLSPKGTTRVCTVDRVRELEAALPKRLAGTLGIGHTRWATHGPAEERNAHQSTNGRISVVHNGIIDNAAALRSALSADDVELTSDTDTEVFAHIIALSEAPDLGGRRHRRSRAGDGHVRPRCHGRASPRPPRRGTQRISAHPRGGGQGDVHRA